MPPLTPGARAAECRGAEVQRHTAELRRLNCALREEAASQTQLAQRLRTQLVCSRAPAPRRAAQLGACSAMGLDCTFESALRVCNVSKGVSP